MFGIFKSCTQVYSAKTFKVLTLIPPICLFIRPQNGGDGCPGPSKAFWEICNSDVRTAKKKQCCLLAWGLYCLKINTALFLRLYKIFACK